MTFPQQAPAQTAPPPPPFVISPEPGDKLDDLLGQLEAANARVQAAEEIRDAIDAAIKSLATAMAPPGTAVIDIAGNSARPARRLAWGARRTFRRKEFELRYPGLYEQYQAYGKGFWGWRKVQG